MNSTQKAIFLLILLFGIFLRTSLPFHTVAPTEEPDVAYYLGVINISIHTGIISNISTLSGFPVHNKFAENTGIIALGVYPAEILSIFGINVLSSMHLVVLLFSTIAILLAYIFTLRITGNQNTALIAMFIMATIPAAIFKGSILEWRGETFIPVLLGLGLFLIAEGINKKNSLGIILGILGLIIVISGFYTWNGATYIYPVMAVFIMLLAYSFFGKNLLLISLGLLILIGIAFFLYGEAIVGVTNPLLIAEIQPTSILFILAAFYLSSLFSLIGLIYIFKDKIDGKKEYIVAILAIFIVTIFLAGAQERWAILIALPVAVLAGIGFQYLFELKGTLLTSMNVNLIFGALIVISIIAPIYQLNVQPSGFQDSSLMQAMSYISQNTPKNATVLTLWDDGSFVEGYANRVSYTDSVSGLENVSGFISFLFENQSNLSYIKQINPEYLFIRKEWTGYLPSLESEAGFKAYSFPNDMPINNLNSTNLYNLWQQKNITADHIRLVPVYVNANDTVYKVEHLVNETPFVNTTKPPVTNTSLPGLDEGKLQLVTALNITVNISASNISPETLYPNSTTILPIGYYLLTPSEPVKMVIAGNAILNGSKINLKGNAILYLNRTG